MDKGLPVTRVISRITLQVRSKQQQQPRQLTSWVIHCSLGLCRCGDQHCILVHAQPWLPACFLFTFSCAVSSAVSHSRVPVLLMFRVCVTRLVMLLLQEILADACERIAGPNVIENSSNVVAYEELRDPATGAAVHCGVCCECGDVRMLLHGVHAPQSK